MFYAILSVNVLDFHLAVISKSLQTWRATDKKKLTLLVELGLQSFCDLPASLPSQVLESLSVFIICVFLNVLL